jgi:signal transduction histidine kinase
MERKKSIENIKSAQTPIDNSVKPLEQSNLEESKDLKILELENKLKNANKLLHLVAHDLRSPLANLVSMLDLYKDDIEEMSKNELSEGIVSLSNQSEKTLKLLIDLSAFTYNRINEKTPETSELNLMEQIEASIDPLLGVAKQKQINFDTSGINKEIKVLADSKMLQTIIRNLSSNAIKFTNLGGNVLIKSEKVNNSIEISVIDDGVGLSENKMDKLFEKIGETKPGTNKEKGTGFGLNFCKELVDEMGGSIRVESVEGHGAKFIVSLPIIESNK